MPVDDLAGFEVLAASDGPDGSNHTAQGGTHSKTVATWTEAVGALWNTPQPRVIVAAANPAATSAWGFLVLGGVGLRVVPTDTRPGTRYEVYRCRSDAVIIPTGTTGGGAVAWTAASPTIAATAADPSAAAMDAYVLSADPAHRARSTHGATPANGFHWLSPDGEATASAVPPLPTRHRWRWVLADASRAASPETFPLAHAVGGPREMRTTGRVTVAARKPGNGGDHTAPPVRWRCFRLAGDNSLTADGSAPAHGWMFQSETEPLLASPHFLSLERRFVARYLQIERTVGAEVLNVAELWAGFRGARHRPVAGGCDPPLPPYDWSRLADGSDATFAHTGGAPNARMWIDLGSELPVDRVGLVNRMDPGTEGRIVGTALTLRTAAGVAVWRYPIATAAVRFETALPAPTGDRCTLRTADGRTVRRGGRSNDDDALTLRARGGEGGTEDLGAVTLRTVGGEVAGAGAGFVAVVADSDGACVRAASGAAAPLTLFRGDPFRPTTDRTCLFQLIRMPGGFSLAQDGRWVVAAAGDTVALAAANPLLFVFDTELDPRFLRDAATPFP